MSLNYYSYICKKNTMKEILHIKGFGGIDNFSLTLNPQLTLIIGPQTSGKSIVAKLLYFFKYNLVVGQLMKPIIKNGGNANYKERLKDLFIQIFPSDYWPDTPFSIVYEVGDAKFEITRDKKELTVEISESVEDAVNKFLTTYDEYGMDRLESASSELYHALSQCCINVNSQIFIVAGRSYFSEQKDYILPLLAQNPRAFDPIAKDFATMYYSCRRLLKFSNDKQLDSILARMQIGNHIMQGEDDFFVHEDGRKVEIGYASSGQQEVLPLLVMLRAVQNFMETTTTGMTLYIEEPEAHLFPSAQEVIVDAIAYLLKKYEGKLQIVVTTHSPYILNKLTLQIKAKQVSDKIKDNKAKLEQLDSIIPSVCHLDCKNLSSYQLKTDGTGSLLSTYDGLPTDYNDLNNILGESNNIFNKLLDIEE